MTSPRRPGVFGRRPRASSAPSSTAACCSKMVSSLQANFAVS